METNVSNYDNHSNHMTSLQYRITITVITVEDKKTAESNR